MNRNSRTGKMITGVALSMMGVFTTIATPVVRADDDGCIIALPIEKAANSSRTDSQAAAIELVSPRAGETVETLPDEQIEVMSISTLTGRIVRLSSKVKELKGMVEPWRRARRLTLKWRVAEGETGPWEILIGKSADFSDARAIVLDPRDVKSDSDGVLAYDVPQPNLEIGTVYHWKVTSNIRCTNHGHVRGCGCKHSRPEHSAAAYFRTADHVPRWISLEGRVGNIRDLGGAEVRLWATGQAGHGLPRAGSE